MRNTVHLLVSCILLTVNCATFTNPVWPYDFPDPFILLEGTTYYAYGTDAQTGPNTNTVNIQVLMSQAGSLSNWKFVGDALPNLPSWAQAGESLVWAPAVYKQGDSNYILYYTARYIVSGKQCVSYAISSTPTGPFVDPNENGPWLCQLPIGGSIDASPFLDTTTDQLYLIWKNDGNCCNNLVNIWSQPLYPNGTDFVAGTTPTALITNDQAWEANIVEGPSMVVRPNQAGNNVYYLFYSANWYASYQYAVGYATCSTPTGPCVKPTYSPIISFYGTVWGPGGEQPFYDTHGDLWFCYHAWTAPNATYPYGARSLRIDRLNFNNDVPLLADHVPTTEPVTYQL